MADVPLTPDVPEAGLVAALFGEREAAARDYAALLVTRGVEWGLVGPREVARIWSRHVLNSLAVAPLIGEGLLPGWVPFEQFDEMVSDALKNR